MKHFLCAALFSLFLVECATTLEKESAAGQKLLEKSKREYFMELTKRAYDYYAFGVILD